MRKLRVSDVEVPLVISHLRALEPHRNLNAPASVELLSRDQSFARLNRDYQRDDVQEA
jgi:hypothetical protein